MKNILVTGGAGYIGSHTVFELVQAGYNPVVLDNFNNSSKDVIERLNKLTGREIKYFEASYQDAGKLTNILKTETIEGVIHFAADKAVDESIAKPLKYYQNNVAGFITLLDVLLAASIFNFVFSSSAAVYGEPPEGLVTEETICNPASPYGWSKYMDEIILRDTCNANPQLKGIALRYFNVVGAHESGAIGEVSTGKPQNILPVIIKAADSHIALKVFGDDYPTPDGSCLRDYIHVTDLAKAHVAALDKMFAGKELSFTAYNVGTGKPTSVFELINSFETVNGVDVPYEAAPRRAGDSSACYASAQKINNELGWQASKTVEDSVRSAWQWHLASKQKI